MLDLAGHDGAGDAFGLEGFDELGEFAEGEPVDVDVGVGGGAGVDLGVGLFLDGGDDDGESVGACGVEEEEGEAAVAGDEAEVLHFAYFSLRRWKSESGVIRGEKLNTDKKDWTDQGGFFVFYRALRRLSFEG